MFLKVSPFINNCKLVVITTIQLNTELAHNIGTRSLCIFIAFYNTPTQFFVSKEHYCFSAMTPVFPYSFLSCQLPKVHYASASVMLIVASFDKIVTNC